MGERREGIETGPHVERLARRVDKRQVERNPARVRRAAPGIRQELRIGCVSPHHPLCLARTEGIENLEAIANNATVSCAVFVGHGAPLGGPYEYPDGPGYKTVMTGYYCPSSINVQADAFVSSLEDVIDKLQLPSQ